MATNSNRSGQSMEKKILSTFTNGKHEQLKDLVTSLSDNEIQAILGRIKDDSIELVRALFVGLPSTVDDCNKKRMVIFNHLIGMFEGQELSSKFTTELIGLLLLELDAFPSSCLCDLANRYVECIRNGLAPNGKCLELLPKILSLIESKETITVDDDVRKGSEYKSHILNSLCSGRWDGRMVIHLAAMFKDVSLTSDELRFVIAKILRMFKVVDIQELPPIVYQLLLLSTKGHKQVVLDGIISFFVEKDEKSKQENAADEKQSALTEMSSYDQLHHVEGTVILHVTFAIKQDQDLGREFVKYFKANQQFSAKKVLAPFTVALALSVGRIHSFEEQIFDLLKSAVLRSYKDLEKQQDSKWVRELVPDNFDVSCSVLGTIENSVAGWDHITQGLVQLGFALMESFGPKSCFGKAVELPAPGSRFTPVQNSCELGSKILQNTAKTHSEIAAEIVDQLLNRVVTKASAPVGHYLALLAVIVKTSPQSLLDSIGKLKECFDYLSYIPLVTSRGLLTAFLPLFKVSMALKDSLLLVLRKALFSKQVDTRRVAASGFLMLLNNFRILGNLPASQAASQCSSASQIQVDIHVRHSEAGNEALCYEILGNLRRCLCQQADVRLDLYEGLYNVLSSNLHLAGPIIDLLSAQLRQYYEPSVDVLPPVKVDSCIAMQGGDQPITAEPLGHLIGSLVHCILKKKQMDENEDIATDDNNDDDVDAFSEVNGMLDSIVIRMIKCEQEDFELDKSADFSLGSSVGVRNTISVVLVCGIYEVLMEREFLQFDFQVGHFQQLLLLFQCHQKMIDLLKDRPPTKAKEKKGQQNTEAALASSSSKNCSLLSLIFLGKVFEAIYSDNSPSHQESIALLRTNLDFQCYVLSTIVTRLQQINQSGHCDGPDGSNADKILKCCLSIGKVSLKHYIEELQTAKESRQARSKLVSSLCIESFSSVVSIISNRYLKHLASFIKSLDLNRRSSGANLQNETSDQEVIYKHVKKLQRILITLLTSGDEDHSTKDCVSLFQTIGTLAQKLSNTSAAVAEMQNWFLRILKEQAIDDLSTVKILIRQLFGLTKQEDSSVTLSKDIARDLHICLGDIDQEVEMDKSKSFASVSVRSAALIIQMLFGHVEKELDDTDWFINRLKSESTSNALEHQSGSTQQESVDKNICQRLGNMINMFNELLQTAMPVGLCTEALIKQLNNLYTVLTNLVKWCLSLYTSKSNRHMSGRVEKLVKLSGTNLTHFVYSMITYIQTNQNEQLQATTEKEKKKGKKKATSAGKVKVLKETRSIPNLVYAIEQYEKYLIQLSKKSKVDLMSHFKMSTSRDFRINTATLESVLEQEEEEEEDEENEPDENENSSRVTDEGNTQLPKSKQSRAADEGNTQPPKKKAKLKVQLTKTNKKGKKKP